MISVSKEWKAAYPGCFFGLLAMEGLENKAICPRLGEKREGLEGFLRLQHAGKGRKDLLSDGKYAAYEAYFRKFGQGYPVLHQLESVALKGKPIFSPSAVVSAMFMAELENGLLTAGHDLAKVHLPLVLGSATGEETYEAMGGKPRTLQKGDMFLADRAGILSSVLYGPDNRSFITEATTEVLFTVYGVPGIQAFDLEAHLEEIEALVRIVCPKVSTRCKEVFS